MTVQQQITTKVRAPRGVVGSGPPALLASVGFVACYLLTDIAVSGLAASSLPLPDAAAGQVRDWFATNQSAAVAMGVAQAVSVLFLAAFAVVIRISRARPIGLAAVGLMLLSSTCTWILAGVADGASLGTVDLLRTTNFITGGTAHVLALGCFVFVASRAGGFGKAVRVLAVVALTVSVLSLSSLVVSQGAAFILLGRLLCMIWTISAGISLILQRRKAAR